MKGKYWLKPMFWIFFLILSLAHFIFLHLCLLLIYFKLIFVYEAIEDKWLSICISKFSGMFSLLSVLPMFYTIVFWSYSPDPQLFPKPLSFLITQLCVFFSLLIHQVHSWICDVPIEHCHHTRAAFLQKIYYSLPDVIMFQ